MRLLSDNETDVVRTPFCHCEVNDSMSESDFFPTICDACGIKSPSLVDGVGFVPLLKGEQLRRDALYWHYPHYSNQGGKPGGAVRRGDYKLIEFYEDGKRELYNLKEDVGEEQNLAGKMPEKAKELHQLLKDWRKAVDAQMPTPNPDYVPPKQR